MKLQSVTLFSLTCSDVSADGYTVLQKPAGLGTFDWDKILLKLLGAKVSTVVLQNYDIFY